MLITNILINNLTLWTDSNYPNFDHNPGMILIIKFSMHEIPDDYRTAGFDGMLI